MQIVINIHDGCYEEICNDEFPLQDAYRLVAWIKKAKPLPKGHGAIKDVSQIEIPMCEDRAYERWVQTAIDSAPTIIEADEVES